MGEMRRFLISEVDEAFCRQCIIQNSVGMQMEGDDDDDDDDLTYSFEVDEDKENPWQPSRSYAAHAPHIVPRTRTAGQSVSRSVLPFCLHAPLVTRPTDVLLHEYAVKRGSHFFVCVASGHFQTFLRIPFTRESWQ